MAEITTAEWAAELGITVQAANKRIRSHHIPRLPNGKIDRDEANAIWAKTFDPSQTRKKSTEAAIPPSPASPLGELLEEEAENSASLAIVRTYREKIKAKRDKLALDREEKTLILAADATEAWGRMISSARSAILLLPAKLAPRVAPLSDARDAQIVIEKEIHALLTELSEYQPHA
jgi:hypothetical protein